MAAVVPVICSASSASFLSFFLSLMVLYLHCVFQPKPPQVQNQPPAHPLGACLPALCLGGRNKNLPNTIKQHTTIQHILRASLREAGRQIQPVKACKISACHSALLPQYLKLL